MTSKELFINEYGYWAIFFAMMAESCFATTLFVPGSLILNMAGMWCFEGRLSLGIVLAVAHLGVLCGDSLGFTAGRCGANRSKWVAMRVRPFLVSVMRDRAFQEWLLATGFFHFTGIGRFAMPIAFGASAIGFRRWFVLNCIGAAVFVVSLVLIGWMAAGTQWSHDNEVTATAVIDLAVLGLLAALFVGVHLQTRVFFPKVEEKD